MQVKYLHDSKKSDMYFKNAIAYYQDIDSSYRRKNKYFTDGKFDEVKFKIALIFFIHLL
jgi:hypothetical protein